jgi:hypothetical protein
VGESTDKSKDYCASSQSPRKSSEFLDNLIECVLFDHPSIKRVSVVTLGDDAAKGAAHSKRTSRKAGHPQMDGEVSGYNKVRIEQFAFPIGVFVACCPVIHM